MIRLSRFRRNAARPAALAALVMAASLSGASCYVIGGGCSGTNCPSGLSVGFVPDALDGGASTDPVDIDLAVPMDQTFVSLVSCSLPLTGTMQLVCDPGASHSVWGRDQLQFPDGLGMFRVTVSAAGNQLSQRVYTPSYRTHECLCGDISTTSATVVVRVPSQEP